MILNGYLMDGDRIVADVYNGKVTDFDERSTDVFSSDRDGRPIGTEEFLLLDTVTWECEYCK